MFLEISQNLQENTCVRVSCIIKLQFWGKQLYLKIYSGTGDFLWILRNFQEHLFSERLQTATFFNNFFKDPDSAKLLYLLGKQQFLFTWCNFDQELEKLLFIWIWLKFKSYNDCIKQNKILHQYLFINEALKLFTNKPNLF